MSDVPVVRRDDYSDPLNTLSDVFEAIAAVEADWVRLRDAHTLGNQAEALVRLSNSMADLATWHPNFDLETGEIELGDA